jgi:hypothetical protein
MALLERQDLGNHQLFYEGLFAFGFKFIESVKG